MKQVVILVASIDTSTTVVASTSTIQMALATKNNGSGANGSNSKGPNAHCGSGGIGGAGGAGAVGGKGEELTSLAVVGAATAKSTVDHTRLSLNVQKNEEAYLQRAICTIKVLINAWCGVSSF